MLLEATRQRFIKELVHFLIQEAQLPQRNTASAAHVYLRWLTDRAIRWGINADVIQQDCSLQLHPQLSAKKASDIRAGPLKLLNITYVHTCFTIISITKGYTQYLILWYLSENFTISATTLRFVAAYVYSKPPRKYVQSYKPYMLRQKLHFIDHVFSWWMRIESRIESAIIIHLLKPRPHWRL